ncbi:hypothetical protein LOCC1_G002953 [Lachnellula occidentalis]|uniref:CRIB domain-containing protein n=1 Tax=Lachnellula occidentalis TaxID=215460 RepID=A0A8H8UIZ3_9HELO|nr:hypothetical protein LOCC1_G002953 [Lachnellula occidentalis]
MFSLTSSGRAAAPTAYSVNTTKSHSKNNSSATSFEDSLEPAIDGPPSPERIRAYTEQMKRSSIFGNHSRTNTLSSGASSFRSRESAYASTENLSRKSSTRSNISGMTSPRERPESRIGSLFSRSGRRSRRDNSLSNLAPPFTFAEGISEEESAAVHYHGTGYRSRSGTLHNSPPLTQEGRRWPSISEPFNFQHVTHTRQDHLPDLARSSRMELFSEFSAIRASQTPKHGELKEIKVQDLHFDNFSSEALSTPLEETPNTSPQGQRQHGVTRKSLSPPHRPVPLAKSHDNLRVAPPRPPRSPLSPTCPMALPPRTSSRTASVLFDTFDPVNNSSIERPRTAGPFQRPAPFDHPLIFEQQEHESYHETSHALTSPGDDAWPLTAPLAGKCGMELTDVKEEEEETMSRRRRTSRASAELRASRSVPSLLSKTYEQGQDTRTSTVLLPGLSNRASALRISPLSPGFRFDQDWEKDIDYCYENEIEADCDYQWVEEQNATVEAPSITPQPPMDLHLEDDTRSIYHGRFRPSLIVPSAYEIPELSPMSNISAVSSDPTSPSAFLQPNPVRSSYASSFKESHGFNLSPSLLIPTDFRSQMEQESLYGDQYGTNHSTSAAVFAQQEPYCHSTPSDETSSSIVSYRSSNFSRGSARSSSSTRFSACNSRTSKDSAILLGQTTMNETHRSIGSASSLPDLVPSAVWRLEKKPDTEDLGYNMAAPNQIEDLVSDFVPTQHRRYRSLVPEAGVRENISQYPTQIPPAARSELVDENSTLSPVAESFIDTTKQGKTNEQVHGRKVSAPVVSHSAREKGRARASTSSFAGSTAGGKKKAGYMLFPQV